MILLSIAALAAPPAAGEVWTEAAVEARVSDAASVGVTQNLRMGTGPLSANEVLTDLGGEVRLSDTWRAGTTYRFGAKSDPDGRYFAHRIVLDGKGKWKFDPVKLDWRERYQVRLPASGNDARHTIRSRIRVGLDLDLAIEPRIAIEPYVGLGDGNGTGKGVGLDKVRLDAGFAIEVVEDRADIDILYRLEEPVRDRQDFRMHILSVGFAWSLDLRRDDDD